MSSSRALLVVCVVAAQAACTAPERSVGADGATDRVCPVCPVCPSVAPDGRPVAPSPYLDSKAKGMSGDEGPEVAILYHLSDQYVPVKFNHRAHYEFGGCEECHHHSSEVERAPACRECHGKPFKNLKVPGLKGAYHRQCMNCHREQGSGPLGCTDCHEKRIRPDGSSGAPAGLGREPASDIVPLGHMQLEQPRVVFNHKTHVDMADKCDDCHHHQGDVERTPPCRECHNTRATPAGQKRLGLKDAYHTQCLACHSEQGGPQNCAECHKPAPTTGAPAKKPK